MIGNTNDYMLDHDDTLVQNTYYLGLYETLLFSKYHYLARYYTVLLGELKEQTK